MRAEQHAAAFVARDPDQQLGVIGIGDVGAEHGVIGGFLAQLVRFAGQRPGERIEPEDGGGDAGEHQLGPVEPGDVRQFVGDDRLGLVRRAERFVVEQDHRAHQAPADRRAEFRARQQGGAALEAHAALGMGERASHTGSTSTWARPRSPNRRSKAISVTSSSATAGTA